MQPASFLIEHVCVPDDPGNQRLTRGNAGRSVTCGSPGLSYGTRSCEWDQAALRASPHLYDWRRGCGGRLMIRVILKYAVAFAVLCGNGGAFAQQLAVP